MIFKLGPLQSATLEAENAPPPENIMDSDLNKEEVMTLKRQHSHEYLRNVKASVSTYVQARFARA